MDYAGIVWNRGAHGHLALMQVLQNLTDHLIRDASWRNVDKGTHFFNLGLVHVANGDVDAAFRYFLFADEEDQHHTGTTAGDLFRTQRLFNELRTRFFKNWLRSGTHFHDGLQDSQRLGVVERLISSIPDLYLLSRCHLGLFRTCLIFHQRGSNVPQPIGAYLLAVEDLAVAAEASAKRLHFNGHFQSGVTFGKMCNGRSNVGNLGFDLNSYPRKFDIDTKATAYPIIKDALAGDKGAMARVVSGVRNISAHAHPFPVWTLNSTVLWEVVSITLDFITTTSSEVERTYLTSPSPVHP
ncbi:hypothetical protein EA187_09205 [Lujinxingia sediminis]|uniref:LA2681-like HEPN domain-containing protein n=1 Tax=Lujinxingia sediminis TaxID=2480984 RepID=A0ABY0CT49_9DELT|nr:hypothetical protein [Lujinxingia sediminis]RVU44710.1 hypothetical protein EA187_09205 [Lujinxingia sediminis]